MAPNVQDHVVDEVNVLRNANARPNPAEQHVFHTIEQIGKRGDTSEWKQRLAAIAVAVVICTVLYGVLYLAMHFQE